MNPKNPLLIAAIVLGSLLLIASSCGALLLIPAVQTWVVGKVGDKFSSQLHTTVRVGYVHYRPFNQLNVDRVFMSDQQGDTLLYVDQLALHLHPFLLRQGRLDITSLELSSPYVRLTTLPDSTLNAQFLLRFFQTPKDTLTPFPLRVNVDRLRLSGTRLRYNDYLISPLDLDLSLPVLSSDSFDLRLRSLDLKAQMDQLDATFSATLHGTIDSIFADELLLSFRGQRLLSANVMVAHPRALDSLYVKASCREVYVHYALLQDLLSQIQRSPVSLPPILRALGKMHYRGDLAGSLSGLQLSGAFTSDVGTLSVQGFAQAPSDLSHMTFRGSASSKRLALGRLLHSPDLGTIAFTGHGHVTIPMVDSLRQFQGDGSLSCSLLQFKGYDYHDITFTGQYADQEIYGDLCSNDSNATLSLNGLVSFDSTDTHIDASLHLQHLCPGALHLTPSYPDLTVSATSYISLFTNGAKQDLLDNLTGYLALDTLILRRTADSLTIHELAAHFENDYTLGLPNHRVRVQSDFLTTSLAGTFHYTTLPATVQTFVHHYLPSLIPARYIPSHDNNDVDFYIYFRELDRLTRFLGLPTHLSLYPTIKGFMHESTFQMGVQAYVPRIDMAQSWHEDVTLGLNNIQDRLSLSLSTFHHLPKDIPASVMMGDVQLGLDLFAQDDSLDLILSCANTSQVRNEGSLHISTRLTEQQGQPQLQAHIFPTTLVLNDTAWSVHDALIAYSKAHSSLSFTDFALQSSSQMIEASGVASPRGDDSISIGMRNFDINYLLGFTGAGKALSVQGLMTGQAKAFGILGNEPLLEAHFDLPEGGINGISLGHVWADAHLDREHEMMVITGQGSDSSRVMAHVEGKVIPKDKWWGLDITCDSVDLGLVDFWTHKILSHPSGRGYGHIRVFGQKLQTWVTGRVLGKDASITIPAIGATIFFTDSVLLDSCAIRFPSLAIRDAQGHTGTFSGEIRHDCFRNMTFDLLADLHNMQALNLHPSDQSPFYGTVFTTGQAHIHGDEALTTIDVKAKTEPHSKFSLKVNGATTAAQTSSFLTFQHADSATSLLHLLPTQLPKAPPTKQPAAQGGNMHLGMQLEIAQSTEINLIMGAEDGIRGYGSGDVKLDYSTRNNEISMMGTYTLLTGIFNFTLANLIRRQFEIREGSQVIWDGKAESPLVDIKAVYHLTASLKDLFGNNTSQINTNRTQVPVNVVLHMTDRLFNPVLKFSIELPQSDESIQSQVMSVISTDEMLMREVIYLLVFNRFYTPEYMQTSASQGLNATYSLVSSTITGQINSWLSRLTDIFSMGFNFRTEGEGASSSQEYEANFTIHPITRLIINGNFGYRYNDLSNRPFFGDLDIEYMLTEDGKFRAKAYTHTVDKYSLKQANTVQGVGFLFKHDFNWREPEPRILPMKDSTAIPLLTPDTTALPKDSIKLP